MRAIQARLLLVPLVVLGAMSTTLAATDTTTFTVSITIDESCSLNAAAPTDIDFGTFTRSASTANIDAAGNLVVNCSAGTPYNIGLDGGINSTGTASSPAAGQRRMANSGNYVPYDLYQDSARSVFWGNTVGSNTLTGTGTGANQNTPVYGRTNDINVPAGTYSDTITATITF